MLEHRWKPCAVADEVLQHHPSSSEIASWQIPEELGVKVAGLDNILENMRDGHSRSSLPALKDHTLTFLITWNDSQM